MIAVRVRRNGTFVREALFRDLPVTLGRGPENDVVLFDPSVSRAHARLEADELGEWCCATSEAATSSTAMAPPSP